MKKTLATLAIAAAALLGTATPAAAATSCDPYLTPYRVNLESTSGWHCASSNYAAQIILHNPVTRKGYIQHYTTDPYGSGVKGWYTYATDTSSTS